MATAPAYRECAGEVDGINAAHFCGAAAVVALPVLGAGALHVEILRVARAVALQAVTSRPVTLGSFAGALSAHVLLGGCDDIPGAAEAMEASIVLLRDPATGAEHEVATNRRQVRERFAAAAAARQERVVDALRLARVDHLELSTDRPWLDDLVRFVAFRKARLATAARR